MIMEWALIGFNPAKGGRLGTGRGKAWDREVKTWDREGGAMGQGGCVDR